MSVERRLFNFHLVPREKLVFNKDNAYPMEMIEQLADQYFALD